VRQSGRSTKEHTILTPEQALAILIFLKEPVRTMVWLDATTGLRVSELLALRWNDIDFEAGDMHVQRGIVYNVVGKRQERRLQEPHSSGCFSARFTGTVAARDALRRWRRLGLR
jgi:integrase